MKRVNYTLAYGSINKDLRLDFIYSLDEDPESKYKTIRKNPESTTTYIRPSHAMSISEGFEKPRMFIPGSHIRLFFDMLARTVKAVSEKLNVLFPKIGNPEFDISETALQEFTIKDAVSVIGYTALPCVYVTPDNECKPAIRITNTKGEFIRLPLTDAIVISKTYEHLDVDVLSFTILNMMKASRI